MLIRRERPSDILAIRAVHAAAFADRPELQTDREPTEVRLVRELRAGPDWLAELSLVAQAGGVVDRVLDGFVEGKVEGVGEGGTPSTSRSRAWARASWSGMSVVAGVASRMERRLWDWGRSGSCPAFSSAASARR